MNGLWASLDVKKITEGELIIFKRFQEKSNLALSLQTFMHAGVNTSAKFPHS